MGSDGGCPYYQCIFFNLQASRLKLEHLLTCIISPESPSTLVSRWLPEIIAFTIRNLPLVRLWIVLRRTIFWDGCLDPTSSSHQKWGFGLQTRVHLRMEPRAGIAEHFLRSLEVWIWSINYLRLLMAEASPTTHASMLPCKIMTSLRSRRHETTCFKS